MGRKKEQGWLGGLININDFMWRKREQGWLG